MNSNELVPVPEAASQRSPSDARFRGALGLLNTGFRIQAVVEGREHLAEIPADASVIIATTHVSDWDVQIAAEALANDFDVVITNQADQHDWSKLPGFKLAMFLAGQDHFLPLNTHKTGAATRFPFEDFPAMRDALGVGRAVLLPSHNPSFGQLPKHAGLALPYLAHTTSKVVVLPVAVDLDTAVKSQTAWKELLTAHRATVRIGAPISVPFDSALEATTESRDMRTQLGERRDQFMQTLADLLPAEKRGDW